MRNLYVRRAHIAELSLASVAPAPPSVQGTKLIAALTQPSAVAPANTVVASVQSTATMTVGGILAVIGGGFYEITAVGGATSVTLRNLGGPLNAAAGTIIPVGSLIELQASNTLTSLAGGASPASVAPVWNVRDPQFGAVGNGIADDTAAFTLAEAKRVLLGGRLYVPPGTYKITSEMFVSAPDWYGVRGQSILKSGAALRSLLFIQGGPSSLADLTFDGNSYQTQNGVLHWSDSNYQEIDCAFQNFSQAGARTVFYDAAAIITPVVQTGPGPTITIAQVESVLLLVGGNVVLRVKAGNTTFEFSNDGGATYNGTQSLVSSGSFRIGQPFDATTFITDTGLQATAGAGAFSAGTTYAFTVTPAAGLPTNFGTIDGCQGQFCGTIYATAGLTADYIGAFPLNPVLALGTVSVVAGIPIVTGVGTSFLSLNIRDGDRIRIPGAHFPIAGTSPAQFTDAVQISTVLSNTQIAIDRYNPPTASVGPVGYAIGAGACLVEDPGTGGAANLTRILGGLYQMSPQGARFQSLEGPYLEGVNFKQNGLSNLTIGTVSTD